MRCSLFVVRCLLSGCCLLLFVVRGVLFVVCCVLGDVCWLSLFVV